AVADLLQRDRTVHVAYAVLVRLSPLGTAGRVGAAVDTIVLELPRRNLDGCRADEDLGRIASGDLVRGIPSGTTLLRGAAAASVFQYARGERGDGRVDLSEQGALLHEGEQQDRPAKMSIRQTVAVPGITPARREVAVAVHRTETT